MQSPIVPHVPVIGGGELVDEIDIGAAGGGQIVIAAAITFVSIVAGVDGVPAAACERERGGER